MKAIVTVLIVAGIVGLVLSAAFPVLIGIPGTIGSVAVLLVGIGFLIHSCFSRRC